MNGFSYKMFRTVPFELFKLKAKYRQICKKKSCLSTGIRENGNNAKAVAAQIKRVVISPPLQLELSDKELRVVASYPENFELVGIQVKVHRNLNLAVIHSAPVWCLEHLANENVIEFDVKFLGFMF